MGNSSVDVEVGLVQDEKKASQSALDGRRMVTAALLVAMMVTAMEQLVVSPAMPTIIAQLKGFDIYPWVISAFLLAATVSTPIYGKLADMFGRKRVLLFGLVALQPGLDSVRDFDEHGTVDRDAEHSRVGCRRRRADCADDAGGLVHASGAGTRSGALQRGLGLIKCGRPADRRISDRSSGLALGFPGERAVRDPGDRDANLLRDRAFGRADGGADRLGWCRLADIGDVHVVVGRAGRLAAQLAGRCWLC